MTIKVKWERVSLTDLKVGDIFTWGAYHDLHVPSANHYQVTVLFNPDTNSLGFKTHGMKIVDHWRDYKLSPAQTKNVFRIFYPSKEELILNKIKYLDKRYSERKAMCS